MQVIGIDPGLINTGWAVIREDGPKIKLLGSGICTTISKHDMAIRLVSILEQLRSVIKKFKQNKMDNVNSFHLGLYGHYKKNGYELVADEIIYQIKK